MNFLDSALQEIFANISNDYDDNWDYIRFGQKEPSYQKSFVRRWAQKHLNKRGYYHSATIQYWISNSLQIDRFRFLFNNLADPDDRRLLLKVLAYRILGHRKVRLPLNTPKYWNEISNLDKLADKSDFIDPHFLNFHLYKMNLNEIGYPIQFYFTPGGIYTDFVLKQYEYSKNGITIKAKKGDVIIDCGGCWADTALYFANEVGKSGKVISFEFIPTNIEIFKKNTSINELLYPIIDLVQNPLWENSGTKLFYKDQGPGSVVNSTPFENHSAECYTMCIDDIVSMKGLSRVDFIKMDIEGAEMNALKGASQTIKGFQPNLAIALYHSSEDFESIPLLVRSLVPSYKFYFSHCSINREESILFATIH